MSCIKDWNRQLVDNVLQMYCGKLVDKLSNKVLIFGELSVDKISIEFSTGFKGNLN